jgi:succinate dehydrogenase / fumarate reductase, cytochrome b subunit
MATAAPAPPSTVQHTGKQRSARGQKSVQPLRAGQGHSFFWRKLHSLTGIIPIGAFLVEHIISNFETWNGPLAYAQQVKFLNALPLVRVLEWVFIFIPIAYHAFYGLFIWWRGRSNVNIYPWAGNWGYVTQRITGLIAFFYIGYHVWSQRFSGTHLPTHPGAAFFKVQQELSNPWILAFYVLAMIAICWHFAYGVWLFAAKWGITPGDDARRKFGYVCTAGGAGLCLLGLMSIYAIVWKFPNAPEDVMPSQPPGVTMPAPAAPPPGSAHLQQPGGVQ